MNIIARNKIYIKNADEQIREYCKNKLEFPNPDYHKKKRLGFYYKNIPKTLTLYEKRGDTLVLPFGCLKDIYKLSSYDMWDISSLTGGRTGIEYNSSINLYDYQEQAVKAVLRAKNGILVMPCGSGKTQTALEVISRLGRKALWITHTKDLLSQSYKRAVSCYGLSKDKLGKITAGAVEVGECLTFATIQTLVNVNLDELHDYWDVIIVDECHKAVGTPTKLMQFYKVISSLTARYKIGLTATPVRADGLEVTMYALLGDEIYKVLQEDISLKTVPVHIEFIDGGYNPDFQYLVDNEIIGADGIINFTKLINDIVLDKNRNIKILNIINPNLKTLVLSDRVKHLHLLQEMYNNGSVLTGGIKNKDRKNILDDFVKSKSGVMFASYSLAKEGLDIPDLDAIILATPKRDYASVVQSAGRVSRKSSGKTKGVCYDITDGFGMLTGMYRSRRRHYKNAGYILL